jgi:D-alanyl-lipoteichoic acid acyltransferase DltB (MBOAT superfamily)
LEPANQPVLVASIVSNYAAGTDIIRARTTGRLRRSQLLLALSVAGDLALLGYFKYTDFFIATFNQVSGSNIPLLHIELPLGISFFTFTQIAYLVDCLRGEAREYNPARYCLFVTYFFPHLIAGPILHHKEMIPQFSEPRIFRPNGYYLMAGIAMFAIGLFKKVWLADSIAPRSPMPASPLPKAGACHRGRHGQARSPTPCRTISIFRATPTWQSVPLSC